MRKFIFLFCMILVVILLIAGCSGTEKKQPAIRIGSQTFSETVILAEMMDALIEQNLGIKVEHVTNLSASFMVHQAMQNDEVDIATRYTGTEMTGVLGLKQAIYDRKEAFNFVKQEFGKRFNQTVFAPYGFENTYALTVSRVLSDKYNFKNVSDLSQYAPNMKLGTDTSFIEREGDGYKALTKLYGFQFGKTYPMEIGLVYKAVRDKEMDAVIAYSTDGRLKSFGLVTLADDKQFFPPYEAVIVARNQTLDKYPGLREELAKLSGLIDTATMTELNYLVDEKKMPAKQVASEFLKQKGLLK